MSTNKDIENLKKQLRLAAQKYSRTISAELEDYGISTIPEPPDKVTTYSTLRGRRKVRTGGEWDALESLHPQELRRIKERWTHPEGMGLSIDELEGLTRSGTEVPFAQSGDEALEKFIKMTAQIDMLDTYSKTGKIPTSKGKYGSGGDFFDLLDSILFSSSDFDQDLIERGFRPEQLYRSDDPVGYLKTIRENLTPEELHYKEMYEAEKLLEPDNIDDYFEYIDDTNIADTADESFNKLYSLEDDDYLRSLTDSPGAIQDDFDGYIDDAVEYIDDISGPQKLDALNVVVDDLTTGGPTATKKTGMFPGLTARVKSAIDQSIDLAIDVSNDISKGASAGAAVVSSAKKTASTAAKAAGSTDTAKSVIQSMKKARTVVSGMSTAKKTGITLGALGTIGAFSSNSRDRRRN